jgi:hypothetical protein
MPYPEINTRLSSRNLYHFTPSMEGLKLILKNGFRAAQNQESEIWQQEHSTLRAILGILDRPETPESFMSIPMVCFCDMPLKLSRNQRLEYGAYGLAMSKGWGIDNDISPVHYVPKDSLSHILQKRIFSLAERLKLKLENDAQYDPDGDLSNFLRLIFESYQLVKRFNSQDGLIKYYDEREWRYLAPSHFNYYDSDTYLKFTPEDIEEIVLPSNKEKKEIVRYINELGLAIKPSKLKVRSLKKKIR